MVSETTTPLRVFPLRRSGRFGFFNDSSEDLRVTYGQVRQHFTIELNASIFHGEDQPAVAYAIQTSCGIDTGDPQFTQITLADFTVASGVPQTLEHCFVGPAEKTVPRAKVALIHLQYFLVAQVIMRTTFYTSHCLLLCQPLGAGGNHLLRTPNGRTKNGYDCPVYCFSAR